MRKPHYSKTNGMWWAYYDRRKIVAIACNRNFRKCIRLANNFIDEFG